MRDVIIIGGGPAGVSAALYTARAGLRTAIVYKDAGALLKAERIENFYGCTLGGGAELFNAGLRQARALGVEIINEEVTGLTLEKNFKVNDYDARAALIATGAARFTPKITGLKEFEGCGVSYCAVCDGFFFRKKDVAVLGSGAYAVHETETLLPLVKSVTILTDGKPLDFSEAVLPEGVKVITEPIAEITGGNRLEAVRFENSGELGVSGLFVAIGIAGGTDLARKIGAAVKDNYVVTDAQMRTSVPGLWAAGDCAGGLKQVAKAVYEGALAGMDIIKTSRSGQNAI